MQDVPADFYEPPEFKGLLFYDGVDSIGRPVVVVDFDAVAPSTTRSAVMQYILQRLEPIVSQVLQFYDSAARCNSSYCNYSYCSLSGAYLLGMALLSSWQQTTAEQPLANHQLNSYLL